MKTTRTLPSGQIGRLRIDDKYPNMYRVFTSEITVSDRLNLTRAKELAKLIKEKENADLHDNRQLRGRS